MKFSFATAFLTLTAASGVVFAIPTESASDTSINGIFAFSGTKIEGKVLGKTLVGKFTHKLPIPHVVVPAHYKFAKFSDLTGKFKGIIAGGKLSITYDKHGATITGKAGEGPHPIFIEGELKVL